MRFSTITKSFVRTSIVLVGVVVLTSVSIDATDSFRSSQSALSILARKFTTPGCSSGTVSMNSGEKTLCVDSYEASVGVGCPVVEPQSDIDTATNANDIHCKPVSQAGKKPWRFVTEVQADQLCARAGKRLLTTQEWYLAARGTPDSASSCNTNGSLQTTGSLPTCISGIGAFDMVGNVWELVTGTVVNGMLEGEMLPSPGYVAAVYTNGVAQKTEHEPNVIYNKDYFWSDASGTFALMRGGYYGSGEDGGMYSAHADIVQNFSGGALGFRCVQTL